MPLRSVVYRSFVTCDDPKGVADCKTIRKSKHKTTNHMTSSNDDQELNLQNIQIMQVSRGADKLNQIVQNRSKFIAQDLLRGALHLQDSLLLLTKLQSKRMHVGPLPPSPRRRDCYDELREVIRESFARQKILPGKEIEGSCLDLPSTSSSRSDGSPRGSNVIAKLMGLEGVPSRRGNSPVFRPKEEEKFSSLIDIDLIRPKKEGRKLEEMIETMHFKGLLARNDDVFLSRKSSAVEDPPIVIMKPLHRSINEEKRFIKSTKTQNVREAPRPPKKKVGASTVKTNQSKPPVPRVQKKESVVKKIGDDKPKIAPNRKQEEAKVTKDVGKKVSTLRRESHVSKGQIAEQKEIIKRASLKSSLPSKNLGKKAKSKSKPSSSPAAESVPSGVNTESNSQGSLVKPIAEEVINPCYNVSISDNVCESSEPMRKSDVIPSRLSDEPGDCESRTSTRRLLLSSASFLNHVEELFDIGKCVFSSDCDKEVVDDPLLLDCAKELLSRKSLRCRNARMVPSSLMFLDDRFIQELVGEISDGIECLRRYSQCCGDVLEDSIYPMLERDLRGNEEVIGAWDLGWRRDGYTMEAMKEVVHDLEKLILRELVDDVVVEFTKQL